MARSLSAATIELQFQQLRQGFLERLGVMMGDLEASRRVLTRPEPDREATRQRLEAIYQLTHRITGSAGSFGLPQLSRAAAPLENLLAGLRRQDNLPKGEELDQITAFIDTLLRTWERLPPAGTPLAPGNPEPDPVVDERRLIYLVEEDNELSRVIVEQLTQFGYEIRTFRSPDQVRQAMTGILPAAVIADLADISRQELRFRHIRGLGERTPLVMLDNRADIATRLAAVRAGASAYLVKPVETEDLVEWLDRLTRQSRSNPYRILIVDDDEHLAASYALILQMAGMETVVLTEPLRILEVINDHPPDLILMDVFMPGCSGIELAQVVRQHWAFLSIPIVFLSVESDVNRQLVAQRLGGGDDFLSKPIEAEHLTAAVLSRAERARTLRGVMQSDSLTGLLNHVHIKERLGVELARARRHGLELSLALLDLDHFKSVNDRYGHLTGDRVIKALASLLTRRLRKSDVIGRYGGEEFAVLLPNTGADQARGVMEEIRTSFETIRHALGKEEFTVTLSCGLTGIDGHRDPETLIEAADQALYQAKAEGRNRVVLA